MMMHIFAAESAVHGAPLNAAAMLPLFVAVPLVAAALAVIVRGVARDVLHLAVPAAGIFAGVWLYAATYDAPLGHNVGLYSGGVAIPFVADGVTALMIVATSLVALTANWFATVVGETRARFYPALALMLTAGVNGALMTGDLFNLFVFIEVMLLPSYGLIAMTGTWSRLAGGRMFVLVNLATSTVLLIGVSLVYATYGSANIAVLAGAARGDKPVVVAMGLVVIALVVKAGVFPVHTWLPRTYPGTSPAVMALFSGLHTKVAVYALFRIFTVVFGLDTHWSGLIMIFAIASMMVGSFAGLGEYTMRRVVAYQMVGGMPFIVIMLAFVGFDPKSALAAGLFYMLHHMVTIGALVLTTGAIEETYGTGRLHQLSGLARRDPLVAAVFVMGAFSIVGLPPFSGVWAKVFAVMEIARSGDTQAWVAIGVIIVASLGALFSMLRLWREVFWGKDMDAERTPPGLVVTLPRLAPAAAMAAVSLAMFVAVGPLFAAVDHASTQLVDVDSYQHAVLGDPADAVGKGH